MLKATNKMTLDDKASELGKIVGFGLLINSSGSTGRLFDMGKYKISSVQGEIEEKIGKLAKKGIQAK